MTMADVKLRPFQPGDEVAFRTLNEAWIAKHFGMEAEDHLTLGDPVGYILQPGGHIFMAVLDGTPIGCCALIADGPGTFEVAKMAVDETYRGKGIGRQLLAYTIAQAKTLGATTLHLASNSKLANAVHLYEALGFRHIPPERVPATPYVRANVFMDMQL